MELFDNVTSAFSTLKRIGRMIKYGSREKIAIFIASVLFILATWLKNTDIEELKILQEYKTPIGIYICAGLFIIYAAYRIIYKIALPKAAEDITQPNSIKGLMAFTAEDGTLFRRLERDNELAQLKNYVLNPQIALLVMMGESGAGKTSLLRAGLSHILKDSDTKYIYWEALPHDSVSGLLKTIKQGLGLEISQLSELLTASIKAVIVLDQFEQLLPDKAEHKPIFDLLKQIFFASPPHTITWIVAFREEYSKEWRKFECDHLHKLIYTITLELFTPVQANNVMATLAEEAGLNLEQELLNNFIDSVQHDNKLSPVDIGIGLFMLQELSRQKQRQELSLKDYQFAGGSQGLFVSFLKTKIKERFGDTQEQEALFKALLGLIDLQHNQRIAEGKTLLELSVTAQGLEPRLLEYALENFASSQVRLLERITHPDNSVSYRLPHESMIPTLRQLGNSLLGEVAQVDLVLETAFIAWKNSTQRNKRYLLSGKELKQVLQFQQQLNIEGKTEFLKKSLKQRSIKRTAIVLSTVLLSIASYSSYHTWQDREYELEQSYRSSLSDWSIPEDLINYSEQVNALSVSPVSNLTNLNWLAKFKPLKTLNIDLKNTRITNLIALKELTGLTSLNLNLNGTQITDLSALKELKGLTTLDLDLTITPITNLSALKALTGLTSLHLNLWSTQISDLSALKALTGLTSLNLDLNGTPITDLSALKELTGLTSLNINLYNTRITDRSALKTLTGLTSLNLYLNGTPITDLSALKALTALTSLDLNLWKTQITDLSALKALTGLTTLNLTLVDNQKITDLSELKALTNLTTLNLTLNNSQITDLSALKELTGLTTLNLALSGSGTQITDLSALKELTRLTTLNLDLRETQITDLSVLRELTKLTTLNLTLVKNQKITDLSALKTLKDLTSLNLILGDGTQITDLSALNGLTGLTSLALLVSTQTTDLSVLRELTKLTKLDLSLWNSQITDLSALKELKGLTSLDLDLRYSKITDLSVLKELKNLTMLNLKLNSKITNLSQLKDIPAKQISLDISNTQIKSLKGLPPSVTELTIGN